MTRERIREVQEVAFHRNGIAGEGFYAVRFTSDIEVLSENEAATWNVPASKGESAANFLAIVFDGAGQCAVICLDHIAQHGVRFGGNSWRGDQYEPELRAAIETTATSGGVRVGPFCIPTV